MSKYLLALALFCAVTVTQAQSTTTINVGGTSINLPIPKGFVDGASAAPEMHSHVNSFNSDSIIMYATFFNSREVERFYAGGKFTLQGSYEITVEKPNDQIKLTQQQFNELASLHERQIKTSILELDKSQKATLQQIQREGFPAANLNTRMKSGFLPLSFSKNSSQSFVVSIIAVANDEQDLSLPSVVKIHNLGYVLVKNKLLMVVRFQTYKTKEDILQSRAETKRMMDAILLANK